MHYGETESYHHKQQNGSEIGGEAGEDLFVLSDEEKSVVLLNPPLKSPSLPVHLQPLRANLLHHSTKFNMVLTWYTLSKREL
jgi:hypothetical protein